MFNTWDELDNLIVNYSDFTKGIQERINNLFPQRDYPEEGTPEWKEFVNMAAQTVIRLERKYKKGLNSKMVNEAEMLLQAFDDVGTVKDLKFRRLKRQVEKLDEKWEKG